MWVRGGGNWEEGKGVGRKKDGTKCRGGSRIFSRGGGFTKKIENFDDLFFRSTKLIFRALPKHCFAPIFGKFFCAAGKFLKKQ